MKNFKKYLFSLWGEICIFLLFLVVSNNVLNDRENIIEADGRGYYEFLPAAFIYHDLSLSYLDTLETEYYDDQMISRDFYPRLENGQRYDKYFIGTAVLQSPFFAVGHLWAKASDQYADDGFSRPYQQSISIAGLFYAFFGLVFIRLLLRSYQVNRIWILAAQCSVLFCSSMLNYVHWDAAYSHVYSFFLVAGFLYFARNFILHPTGKSLFWTIFFLGFIFLVRPVNVLIVLFIPLLTEDFKTLLTSLQSVFTKYLKITLLASLAVVLLYQIQCIVWYQQTGHWFHYAYGNETFNWHDPHFIDFLFSYRKGFFLWAPWFLVAIAGGICFHLVKKNWFHLVSFLLSFSLLIYVLSSWWSWTYGGSMGSRPMIDFYPVILAFMAPMLAQKPVGFKWIVFATAPILAYVMLVQVFQYQRGILKWDHMTREDYWKVFLKKDRMYDYYLWKTEIPLGEKISETNWIEHQSIQPGVWFTDTLVVENTSVKMPNVGQITFISKQKTNAEPLEIRLLDQNDSLLMNHYNTMLHCVDESKGNQFVDYRFLITVPLPEKFKAVFVMLSQEKPVTIDSMKMRFFAN